MDDIDSQMSVLRHGGDASDQSDVPARLNPQFSLAYLRQADDPALLMTPDGRVTFLNDAACELFNLQSVQDVKGRQIWELWPDLDAEDLMKLAISTAANGEAVRFPLLTGKIEEMRRWTNIFSPVMNIEGDVESIFALVQPA